MHVFGVFRDVDDFLSHSPTAKCGSADFNNSAHAHGIETVYQDKSLGEKQVLWRNFFIGREIVNRFGFIDVKKEKAIANEIMVNTIGFRSKGITVDSNVSQLSGGERQGIAIGRALHFEADLIILDEPTVALSLKEVAKVINFVHKIKEGGNASIYISHSIPDVYEVSDRFIVGLDFDGFAFFDVLD
jgi:simple sugar transport system ATP-binding protein